MSAFKRAGNPGGVNPLRPRADYAVYESPYGPSGKTPFNIHGIDLKTATRIGLKLGAWGGVAGFFALFFFADVPRVRIDIMQKIPILGERFEKNIPPEDNPF